MRMAPGRGSIHLCCRPLIFTNIYCKIQVKKRSGFIEGLRVDMLNIRIPKRTSIWLLDPVDGAALSAAVSIKHPPPPPPPPLLPPPAPGTLAISSTAAISPGAPMSIILPSSNRSSSPFNPSTKCSVMIFPSISAPT